MRGVFIILLLFGLISFSTQIIIFKSYFTNKCFQQIEENFDIFNIPLFDREYGIDPVINGYFHGSKYKYITGKFYNTSLNNITFCDTSNICTDYPIIKENNSTLCQYMPIFGYGHFEERNDKVLIELYLSSNKTNDFQEKYCSDYEKVAWYAKSRELSKDKTCVNTTGDIQYFYNESVSDRISFFRSNINEYDEYQPCQTKGNCYVPIPECREQGTVYCVNLGLCTNGINVKTRVFKSFGNYTYGLKVLKDNLFGNVTFDKSKNLNNTCNVNSTNLSSFSYKIGINVFLLFFIIFI